MSTEPTPRRRKRVKTLTATLPEGMLTIPNGMLLTEVQKQRIIDYRREQISDMMLKGYTQSRIADALGLSLGLVAKECKEVQQGWRDRAFQNIEEMALLDIARLDFIIAGLLPRVLSADIRDAGRAAEAVIKAIQERGAILGYRHGVMIDIEAELRQLALDNGFDPEQAVEVATRLKLTMSV